VTLAGVNASFGVAVIVLPPRPSGPAARHRTVAPWGLAVPGGGHIVKEVGEHNECRGAT
jgi:hypothetical protein